MWILNRLQQFAALDRFADSLRVLLALTGVVCFTGLRDNPDQLVPLLLGVIASAIAKTNDSGRRRARALLITLICFCGAAFAVELLFELPWLFGAALLAGSFMLAMMGVVSARYATIAYATLLLAIYTMIGVDQHAMRDAPLWREPLLLLAGAGWYGLLALAWNALFVQRPVRQALAHVYDALGHYLACKAALFEPRRELDVPAQRMALAQANARVVAALNETGLALIDRLDGRRSRTAMDENLRLYLGAQDLHERASSSHYPYQALANAFFHSDLMFRGERLIRFMAGACAGRARALRLGAPFTRTSDVASALDDFEAAVEYQRRAPRGPGTDLMYAVDELAGNMHALATRLTQADAPAEGWADRALQNSAPESLYEIGRRLAVQLTPASACFRHALRLALAMLADYIVLRFVHPEHGYWILLTTMMVCQPDYGATRRRVVQRVGGTALGLVIGWALLRLFPAPEIQLLLIVAAGMIFFATRFRRYVMAAAVISVLVLLAFNQVGNGFDLIVPRLLDTVIGGAIAAAAMLLVLPDWRERELHRLLARALTAHSRYLRAIFVQYSRGKQDDLVYRIARRDAHNADAAVSTHVATALRDPHGDRTDSREAFAVLACAQTLIGHLSTLGAHRAALVAHADHTLLTEAVDYLADSLVEAGHALIRSDPMPVDSDREASLRDALASWPPDDERKRHLIAMQLKILIDELPHLRRVGQRLTA